MTDNILSIEELSDNLKLAENTNYIITSNNKILYVKLKSLLGLKDSSYIFVQN